MFIYICIYIYIYICVCVFVHLLRQASLHIWRFNGWNSEIHINLSFQASVNCYKSPEIFSVRIPLQFYMSFGRLYNILASVYIAAVFRNKIPAGDTEIHVS